MTVMQGDTKKKVGIVTFHTALNYGAIMQSYALQHFLYEKGIDNEIIDYRCPFIEKCYSPFFVSDGKVLNSLIRGVMFGHTIRRKHVVFKRFIDTHLQLSQEFQDRDSIQRVRDNYSYFISGSDQVWSPISAGFDPVYFLPFAKDEQKISYAASIGTNSLSDEQFLEYKNRLEGFSCLSVREGTAKDVLRRLDPEREIFVHVDPTLLLCKESWYNLLGSLPDNIPAEYLLIFNVEKPISDVEFAKRKAKEMGLSVVYINDRTLRKDKDIIYVEAPAPDVFLTLFANAKAVVTNSFHGTVFSIVFHKNFFVELDNKKQRNIRVENLLQELNIKHREITNEDIGKTEKIDWEYASQVLQVKRSEASDYFDKVLKR